MRKIEFRGIPMGARCPGDPTFIYGWLECNDDMSRTLIHCISGHEHKAAEVGPVTVEQFTGLYDIAGEKIFEGDIVRYKESNCSLYVLVGAVEFHGGAFGIRWVQVSGESHFTPFCALGDEFDYKVVGNIHEDRDLLEANDET